MREYIYFDWNVIKYALQPRIGKYDDAILPIATRLARRYDIPYSEAHLRDLASGHSEEKKHYSERDVEFLKKLTGSKAVVFARDESTGREFLEIQVRNIEVDFSFIVQAVSNENGATMSFRADSKGGVPIELSLLEKDDIFFAALKDNDGKFDSSVMQRILVMLWENKNDPGFYKIFRRQAQKIVMNIEKRPTSIIKDFPALHTEILPFLKYLSAEKIDDVQAIFIEAVSAFAKFSGRNFKNLTFGAKLELAYELLDFQPLFAEKVTNKNRPSNQLRDMKHLYSASDAKFFVTADIDSLAKSRFIIKVLGMKVRVLDVSEFISRFS
ncbi:hypothetical protein SAMN05192549_115154 [Duganella sacchari]|uniref:PIN domain-containing protein n=1 Tax=Duganella sacchari TaxID=551987 RepID=A0A1M7RAE6_9BURK|nr:hypothetical protein [Duganella sacchari]SHN43018.1 hypothetical protein SAMN05192549_115154 [Duganella sacchari]